MRRVLIMLGLFLAAVVWVVVLALTNPARARGAAVSVPAADGSMISLKYLDKSHFDDQDPRTGLTGEMTLRAEVLDSQSKPIGGLTATEVMVREDGHPCVIKSLTGPASQALNVIFVIDVSGSMSQGNRMAGAQEATLAAAELLQLERDHVGVIAFNAGMQELMPLTRLTDVSRQGLRQNVASLRPNGGTRIGLPALAALQRFGREKLRGAKMVLLMTDGEDGELPSYIPQIVKASEGSGVPVHTIIFGERPLPQAQQMMETLATGCNGKYYHAPSNEELKQIFRARIEDLAREWTIVYQSPFPDKDGLPRPVEVSVQLPRGVVSARTEYQIGAILAGGRRPPVHDLAESPSTPTGGGATTIGLFLGLLALLVTALGAPEVLHGRKPLAAEPAAVVPAAGQPSSPPRGPPPPPPPRVPTRSVAPVPPTRPGTPTSTSPPSSSSPSSSPRRPPPPPPPPPPVKRG